MKTGFKELDRIVDLNKSQLMVCSSADNVIEIFLKNILKNISVEQRISALYIDNNIKEDYTEIIKEEREILFKNKKSEMEIILSSIEVSDNTLDDIVSNITKLDRFKLLHNRIIEAVLTEKEITNLKKDNKIELIDILDGKKYFGEWELFNQKEKEKIKQADLILKSSPLFVKHIEGVSLNTFKEICYEYKNNKQIEIVILNNINTINNEDEFDTLKELQKLSRELNMTIIIGNDLIQKDKILLEEELENIRHKCSFFDTILFLKNGGIEDLGILNIWIMKNINDKLDKVNLCYLEEYCKYLNFDE